MFDFGSDLSLSKINCLAQESPSQIKKYSGFARYSSNLTKMIYTLLRRMTSNSNLYESYSYKLAKEEKTDTTYGASFFFFFYSLNLTHLVSLV